MQSINKAVSSLFTCLKAQSLHSPETWDSALDFSSFGAIKILDRVANDSKLKFDRTAVLYVKYVVDTNQTLPCISVSYYFLSDGGSPTRRSTRTYINPRSRVRSHFTLGTPWSFSCITRRLSLSPSQMRFVLSYALVWRSCERKTISPFQSRTFVTD